MKKNTKKIYFFLIISIIILILFLVIKNNKKNLSDKILEEEVYSTNIIKDVNYTSRDAKGNVYTIDAKEGEIDLSNSSVIFLTDG